MIRMDEDALICDLAETYGILNYRSLPIHLVATLCVGLRENSRIKMKMADITVTFEKIVLAGIWDKVNLLYWSKTKDGSKNRNCPESIAAKLMKSKEPKQLIAFDDGKAFLEYRQKLIGGDK